MSTGIAGRPKPKSRMIAAVLRPIPGSAVSHSRASSSGHVPRKDEVPGAVGGGVHLGQHVLDAPRLRRRQAAGPDDVLELVGRRGEHRVPVGIARAERGEGAERVRVGRVLRQDREHQLADRVDPRTGPGRMVVPLAQPIEHDVRQLPALPPIGRPLLRARALRHGPMRAYGARQLQADADAACQPAGRGGQQALGLGHRGRQVHRPVGDRLHDRERRRRRRAPPPGPRAPHSSDDRRAARPRQRGDAHGRLALERLLVGASLAGDHEVGVLECRGQPDQLGDDLDAGPDDVRS